MKFLYYPGCAQKASSRFYESSFLAVCSRVGAEPIELDDWNCCGATMAISSGKTLALSLAARNLAIAEKYGLPLVTPCPSCWLSFLRVNRVFAEDTDTAAKVGDALSKAGLSYEGKVPVLHVLEFLEDGIGLERIEEQVRVPLVGTRIAPYYGCQTVRPYPRGKDPAEPQSLERIIRAVGAEVVDFPYRTSCCGSSLMVTRKSLAVNMSHKILRSITARAADLLMTPCGLCQTNMELAGLAPDPAAGSSVAVPALNVSQVIAIALGVSAREIGVSASLVSLFSKRRHETETKVSQKKMGVPSVS